ncbi:MAG: hypothetical protein ABID54_14345, partial [Pseudomonadota bacterium]
DLHILEPNTANIKFKRDAEQEWDIALDQCNGAGGDPYNTFTYFLSDALKAPDSTNHSAWKNLEFDRVVREYLAASDEEKARRLCQEAERLLFKDLPYFPVFAANALWAIRKNIHGFRPHDNGFLSPNKLWIER